MLKTFLTALAALCALAACAESDTDTQAAPAALNETATRPSNQVQTEEPITSAGDDDPDLSRPDVQPLAYTDYNQRIPAGSGCSFADAEGRLLFVATADFETDAIAQATVKLADRVFALSANRPGGYNALAKGQVFADVKGTPYEKSSGVAVTIVRLPGKGTPGEIGTTIWPAEMTVSIEARGYRSLPEAGNAAADLASDRPRCD